MSYKTITVFKKVFVFIEPQQNCSQEEKIYEGFPFDPNPVYARKNSNLYMPILSFSSGF